MFVDKRVASSPNVELDASLDLSPSMTLGLGSRLTGELLRQFGSPEEFFVRR
jgi:hypothetical protein